MPPDPDDHLDDKSASKLEGFIRRDESGKLYVLLVNDKVVSTSKHKDYWEYHQRRGDLAKAILKLGLAQFVYAACEKFECISKTLQDCLTCEKRPAFIGNKFVNKSTDFLSILGFCEQQEFKRKRGRPKKQSPMITEISPGVRRNHLSDDEPVTYKTFNKYEIIKMKSEFYKMIDAGDSMRDSLVELTKKYKIPYKRVYELIHG